MTRKQYGFMMVVLAVAAGLIGGVVSSQFFTGEPLFAEERVERVVGIQDGFVRGKEYLEFSQREQCAYAAGIIDGMLLSPLFGASKEELRWLDEGILGRGNVEIAAIIERYLEDNPARQHESLHTIVYSTLWEAFHKP
jgi:hypothetical protein